MMNIKVGAASVNQTPLDWTGNTENILNVIDEAIRQRVTLLCLPELCITGYGCEDRFHSLEVQQRALKALSTIRDHTQGITVCVGLPMLYGNALYNTIAVLHDCKILGFVAKQHLAGDGLHYEPRWFKPWPAGKQGRVQTLNGDLPIGDLMFDLGIRVGFEICEDAWVAERPGSHLARRGVDIILNPSASHFAFGKHEIRQRFVMEGSRAFGVTYVYSNLLGNEAGRAIYDGDCFIATGGVLVAVEDERFSMKKHRLLTAVVDVEATKTQQVSTASFLPEFTDERVVRASSLSLSSEPPTDTTPPDEPPSRFQEFTSAITLGLADYMRKSRSQGFVISLSGGADSAACALLVSLMVERGCEELGGEAFVKHLGLKRVFASPSVLANDILTCLYQKTRNSSETTQEAALAVAEATGAKFHLIDVDTLVEGYKMLISTAIGRDLTWEQDDLTLQNIQARSRAPSVWMLANIENKLLITTSNRSEAAVGYCTMDGDTAGSIAVIGGIDKAFLLKWLRYLAIREERDFKQCLRLILDQAPTAELRPSLSSQTDEADLMPYPILEFIEDRAILDKKGPRDVYYALRSYTTEQGAHPPLPPAQLFGYVEKFFRLWCRNQWKRERYALSFHVDDKNLDPRSWCRFPVLSGGFAVELAELREELRI